jgi:hypothetical protein
MWTRERWTSFNKLGSFCNTCVAVDYFSPQMLWRFDLELSAISIRWRIASEREGLSFCCLARPALLLVPLAPEERAVYLRPMIIEIPQFFVFNPQNNNLYVHA